MPASRISSANCQPSRARTTAERSCARSAGGMRPQMLDRDGVQSNNISAPWIAAGEGSGGTVIVVCRLADGDVTSTQQYNSGSNVRTPTVRSLYGATVVVDAPRPADTPIDSIAAYAAMVAFAEMNADARRRIRSSACSSRQRRKLADRLGPGIPEIALPDAARPALADPARPPGRGPARRAASDRTAKPKALGDRSEQAVRQQRHGTARRRFRFDRWRLPGVTRSKPGQSGKRPQRRAKAMARQARRISSVG